MKKPVYPDNTGVSRGTWLEHIVCSLTGGHDFHRYGFKFICRLCGKQKPLPPRDAQ